MTSLESGLYVRIEELDNGPKPFPLTNGFSMGQAYRALGLYNPSETSDAYFVLSNDRDEIWFICNRHVRAYTNYYASAKASTRTLKCMTRPALATCCV